MRFSFNIIAASVLFLSSSVLAAYEHDLDAVVARHQLDEELAARGETTELELRAMLVARVPNGDCSTASPQRLGGTQCYHARGYGWKIRGLCYGRNQMILRGDTFKGDCYF